MKTLHIIRPKEAPAHVDKRGNCPATMCDSALVMAVCRANSSGAGPIICSPNCVSYSGCEIGHEWQRRPHLWR
jgi:hypothetical protein